jgi:hypothetical protein
MVTFNKTKHSTIKPQYISDCYFIFKSTNNSVLGIYNNVQIKNSVLFVPLKMKLL